MIKVNCKDGIESVKEEYPYLKKGTAGGRIVLFTAPGTGYELHGGRRSTHFHSCNSWLEAEFRLYPGTVELSNEL